jgi:hypothetical protein
VNWKIRCCPEVETVINELQKNKFYFHMEILNLFLIVFNTFDNILENNVKVKLIVPDIIINRTKKYKLKTNI